MAEPDADPALGPVAGPDVVDRARPPGATALGMSGRGVAGRMRWGVVDQGLSSLTNFAIALAVARVSGPETFGAFSVAFVVYLLALSGSRSLVTEPLAVRFSSTIDDRERSSAAAAAAGAALAVGSGVAMAMALAAAAVGGGTALVVIAMAVVLPALLLQDALRNVLLVVARPAGAAANDAVWLGAQTILVGVLVGTGRASASTLSLAFGVSAALAAMFGMVQCRVTPAVGRRTWRWVRSQSDLGIPLLLELVVVNAAPQAALFGAAAVGGSVAVVGGVRGAMVLFGPLTMVFTGLVLVGLPESVRLRRRSTAELGRLITMLGVGMPTVGVAWTLGLLLVPDSLGVTALGANWSVARPLIPAVGLLVASSGCTFASLVGLRSVGAVRTSLRARAWSVPVTWAGAIGGVSLAGAPGAAAGLAVGSCVDAALAWVTLRQVLRQENGWPAACPGI